ncbi:MAG: hypothetical protein HC915_17225 [Anaerolineae bacterium]|nr:hypothetical protein [Anaerolineae bacterium]
MNTQLQPRLEPDVLENLLAISRKMAEADELDTLLNYALGQAMALVDAERAYLVLLDAQGALEFRVKQAAMASNSPMLRKKSAIPSSPAPSKKAKPSWWWTRSIAPSIPT